MIYFLVGPMGCGKNYVGKRLAKELDCDFIDGDSTLNRTSVPPSISNINNSSSKFQNDHKFNKTSERGNKSNVSLLDEVVEEIDRKSEERRMSLMSLFDENKSVLTNINVQRKSIPIRDVAWT